MIPRYWRMNWPGLRSLAAKSPFWPHAGWEGVVMGAILTRGLEPLGVEGGMGRRRRSLGGDLRDVRWCDERVLEYAGAVR